MEWKKPWIQYSTWEETAHIILSIHKDVILNFETKKYCWKMHLSTTGFFSFQKEGKDKKKNFPPQSEKSSAYCIWPKRGTSRIGIAHWPLCRHRQSRTPSPHDTRTREFLQPKKPREKKSQQRRSPTILAAMMIMQQQYHMLPGFGPFPTRNEKQFKDYLPPKKVFVPDDPGAGWKKTLRAAKLREGVLLGFIFGILAGLKQCICPHIDIRDNHLQENSDQQHSVANNHIGP